MPTEIVDAILFDMDGTLIDSTPGVLKAWDIFSKDYGLNAEEVAHATHGRRLYDTIKEFCHVTEEEKLLAEIARFEEEVIQGGPVVLPGGIELIQQITEGKLDTNHPWTIVTSATNYYAPRALEKCGVPLPPAGLVTSNDVSHGKPLPDPYLAGAKTCGVAPENCVVIEDAPSGIRSGKAAGCKTIAVLTSHTKQAIVDSGCKPDYVVRDLTCIRATWKDGRQHLEIQEAD